MNEPVVFLPTKKTGLTIHIGLGILLIGGIVSLLWLTFMQTTGALTVLCLFGALLVLGLLIFIAYRAYALMHASYTIQRDGLSIRWGLRQEDIPFNELEWIRPIGELTEALRPPAFSMPGAYLGTVTHADLGTVEFIASDENSMVVIGSFNNIFVLSPEQPEKFMTAFNRTLEMGSISPIEAHSSQPAEFLRGVLSDPFARVSLFSSLILTLVLVVLTSLLIPFQSSVSMGLNASGGPMPVVSSSRLLLLPLLGSFVWISDVIAGLFLYRHTSQKPVSYSIWSAAMLTPFLLIIALLLIVF
jgi:uncharacterized membrane protein